MPAWSSWLLAAGYDLRVFFSVVSKPAEDIRVADVLSFITAQRTGRSEGAVVQAVEEGEAQSGVRDHLAAQGFDVEVAWGGSATSTSKPGTRRPQARHRGASRNRPQRSTAGELLHRNAR
jgi:integrase/recombinase XerD